MIVERWCWHFKPFKSVNLQISRLFSCTQISNYGATKDLIVIGGGSGGLACAKEAADLGKNVAVLDFVSPSPQGTKWDIGGTCVNVGCIPKKLMHQAALIGQQLKNCRSYGWMLNDFPPHDWATLSQAVQMYIRSLNWGHKVQISERNIQYVNGKGCFMDKNTIRAVNAKGKETILQGDNIVIAVGGRPSFPEVPGAREHCLTSDDIFWRLEPPGKTLVIGGSYVGLECAGFLHGLGCDTTLMIRSVPLRGFDQQAAGLVLEHMRGEGLSTLQGHQPTRFERDPHGRVVVHSCLDRHDFTHTFDTVLLATGRRADTANLGLEKAGVGFDPATGKIAVDECERTNVDHVFAIGDVAMDRPELTPVAVKAGKLLARRLFSSARLTVDYDVIPTTVFTPLEYGCVGLSEDDAVARFGADHIEVYHAFYKPLEFALPQQSHEQCYVKVIATRRGRVVGLHFVGPSAGEVVQGFAVAMRCGMTRDQLEQTVGIHPTCAEEVVRAHVTKRSGRDPRVSSC